MGNIMEALIMMALLVFMVTNLVAVAITVWFVQLIAPIYRPIIKQMKKMYSELETEGAE